jgi:hypothetical protein
MAIPVVDQNTGTALKCKKSLEERKQSQFFSESCGWKVTKDA